MEYKPPTRLGLIWGSWLLLALVLLNVWLVVLMLSAPITPLTVIRGLLALVNLLMVAVVLYALISLNRAAYWLDGDAIIIRWGATEQTIPLAQVKGVLQGMDLGRLQRFQGLRLPGYWLGKGKLETHGSVTFFASAPLERQLVIKTANAAFAISPQDPDQFMDHFARQLNSEFQSAVEPKLVQPELRDGGLFSDRPALGLLAAGGLGNALLMMVLTARFHQWPVELALLGAGGVTSLRPSSHLLALGLLGTAAWLLNGVLGIIVYRRWKEKGAAMLLWGAAVGLQFLLFGVLLNLS